MGFQLLLAVVVAHNALLFDEVRWGAVLVLTVVVEIYVVVSWLLLRRWFLTFPHVGGWDLSDLFFIADLLLWAAAIRVTGGPLSLLWILPLLRIADHHTAAKVWVFAHLGPLAYALAAFWPPRPPAAPGIEADLFKIALLYLAGVYVAWTGLPAHRHREKLQAAISTAAALLAKLTDRTERLDAARRSRSALVEELGTGIRTSLIEIVGFSRFLLRSGGPHTDAEEEYLERIHNESRSVLRALEGLGDSPAPPLWPRISLSGLLQRVTAEEAGDSREWRESAVLDLPYGDVELRADEKRLAGLLRHMLAACRHFQKGPPVVEITVEPATAIPAAVVMTCPARLPSGAPADDLFNPFAEAASGDQEEMAARLELSVARSIAQSLGYELGVSGSAGGTVLMVSLR